MTNATNTKFSKTATRAAWVIGITAIALTDMASAVAFMGMEEIVIASVDTIPSTLA